MSYWFHRNPLKGTATQKFEIKMFSHDPEALKILGDLRQSRARVLELLPDPNHTHDQISTALKLYLALVRGLLLQPGDVSAASKLKNALTFRWNDSVIDGVTIREDAVFEVASIVMNTALWYMKHAVLVAVKPEISMEDAKEVHTSLRRAAGLIKFVQDTLLAQLDEKPSDGGDLDGRVVTAYMNQCTAEAQEVTIARAIELGHNPKLISSLATETSRLFSTAAESLSTLDKQTFAHWKTYFGLKCKFYSAYAYNYQGEALLAEDKCGDAIRSLQESKKLYLAARELAVEYAKTKGRGTQAKPEKHQFFTRILPIINRTLEKCERENGFIYHHKVPYDPVELEMNSKTHGLVSPEEFEIPTVSPLWTPMAYAAFDESKLTKEQEKKKSKSEKKEETEVKAVKEVPIPDAEAKHNNESGCTIS